MKEYVFWYSETWIYKGGFEANSEEEARELLNKVMDGEIAIESLPGFWNKEKGYEAEFSPETLDEINSHIS